MKVSKPLLAAAALPIAFGACTNSGYNDYYDGQANYNPSTGYGDYNQAPPGYGPVGGGNGTDYGSESADVVSLPGDSGGYSSAPSPAPVASYTTPPAAGGQTYTVKKGDNLYRIGKMHGVTMQEIISQNGLSDTTIFPGQQLIIP